MYILSKKSLPLVDYMFDNYEIYHISELPIDLALRDGGCLDQDPVSLSAQWLYDRTGFYNSINEYNNTLKRTVEFTYHGDYLKTLRQRMNIVHELIKCNLNTNLPVHISCKPKKDQYIDLDLKDKNSLQQLNFIAHPGQTRIQGSIFLRDSLKNVLLYIKKDYSKYVNLKNYKFIKKIKTVEDLLKNYKPSVKITNDNLYYDFFMPGNDNGLKYHKATDSHILKVSNMYSTSNRKLHSSTYYLPGTFISMHNFCSILFNNRVNLYTNNINEAKKLVRNGENKILLNITSQEKLGHFKRSGKYDKLTFSWGFEEDNNYNDTIEANNQYFYQHLSEPDYKFISNFNKFLDENNSKTKYTLTLNIIEEKNIKNLKKVVSRNQKGICLFIDTDKITTLNRDIYELLFCIPADFSLSCNKEQSIGIINCEHEYWSKSASKKQYTLNNNFFK